jgi:hypothetical protein
MVLAGIERMRERIGLGILVRLLPFGILSDERTRRNMNMFAAEIMPERPKHVSAAVGRRRMLYSGHCAGGW